MTASPSFRSALFALLLCSLAACGDEPQRIPKSESKPAPQTAMPTASVRLAGRVRLAGNLAKAQSGAVFMIARNGGRTALAHKYDMSGSDWSMDGDQRVLSFSLTDQDNMGGAGAPVGSKMELEARYDPEGFVDAKQGGDKKGVVKAFAEAAIGDTQISLTLDPAVAPIPPMPPAQAGKPSGG